MFWKKKKPATHRISLDSIEDGIRFAMEHGISCPRYLDTDDPFQWKSQYESIEAQLHKLTELAVEFRKDAREYTILYPKGAAYYFNLRLKQFVADENFKKNILTETTEREVEVQRSRAMVEAVRAHKDRHPAFLELVDAKTLDDIARAEKGLTFAD